jgi:hypothetical protein
MQVTQVIQVLQVIQAIKARPLKTSILIVTSQVMISTIATWKAMQYSNLYLNLNIGAKN